MFKFLKKYKPTSFTVTEPLDHLHRTCKVCDYCKQEWRMMYSNVFFESWWQCMTVINDPDCVCHSIVPARMRKPEVQKIWRQWLEDQHFERGIWEGNTERLEKEAQRLKQFGL